jgi:hypothetical protein
VEHSRKPPEPPQHPIEPEMPKTPRPPDESRDPATEPAKEKRSDDL